MRSLGRFYAILGLAAAGIGLVVLAFATPLIGTRSDFSVYNGGWNGVSDLGQTLHGAGAFNPLFTRADDEAGVQVRPASLDEHELDPLDDAVLIIGPRAPFTAAELAHLRAFLHAGGTLVLADDFGTGNEVLAGVGAQARIRDGRALDFAFAKRPEFTIAIDFEDHRLTDGVQRVLLNYPAAIAPGNATRILANTTEAAWLDTDSDSERDPTEPGGPLGWLAIEPVGNGSLVILSDPSVLINGMQGLSNNAVLSQNLAVFVTQRGGQVVIDEAHRDAADPLGFVGLRIQAMPLFARILLVLSVAGIVLLVAQGSFARAGGVFRERLARLLSAPEEERPTEGLLARAKKRHPDWDETALREVLDGWGVKEPR